MKALEFLKKYQDEIQTSIPQEIELDEIIEELEKLNNRSCENCKYYKPQYYDIKEDILDQWVYCDEIYAETRDLVNFKKFYCSRYESK